MEKLRLAEFIFLALGAVAGAYLRYRITRLPIAIGNLPINILIVNVLGSFVLGLFSALTTVLSFEEKYVLLVAVGFCGSLTTMSSLQLEVANHLDNRRLSLAVLEIIANVGFSLIALIMGRLIGYFMLGRMLQ
ncbi:MAG: fluoride efflux transporter CrcB [Candidatus Bathyarchaeia archaeon]|nr:fluoride efflux transporter CrcB [Candidatus Bathyarchaeota archaeon]